jgi:ABC-type transport system substrate-binding protein
MDNPKRFFFLSRVLLLGFVVVLAWGGTARSADTPSKIINIAFSSTIGNVDPHNSTSNNSANSTSAVFEGLVDDDREGNISPLLAERWEANEAGDRWRFFLRKGVKFHNGEPLDAKDVKCSYDRLIAGKSKLRTAASYWKSLSGCEIVDDYTVDLIFEAPNPFCLKNVAQTAIIPDEAYAQYGDDLWNKQMMYGTGPWVFKEWIEGQYIHMVKNKEYWNKAKYDPYYEEVYLRVILEPATAVAAHLAGDVQVIVPQGGVNKEFRAMYERAADRIQRLEIKTAMPNYLTIQCEEGKVFNDKNARMALEYALDPNP